MAFVNVRWPTTLTPKSCKFTRQGFDKNQQSPRTNRDYFIRGARPLWKCDISWEYPAGSSQLTTLRKWLERLDGFRGSVNLRDFSAPHPYPYGTASFPTHFTSGATVFVREGAAAGSRLVKLAGLQASQAAAFAGQYVQIGRRLYIASADATSDASGNATVYLENGLTVPACVRDQVRLVEAGCEMRLTDQNFDQANQATSGFVSISASFVETADNLTISDMLSATEDGIFINGEANTVIVSDSVGALGQRSTVDALLGVVRASTATYCGSDGLLKTALANVIRRTYDPASIRPLGVLVEGSRTNVLLWSEDLSNAAWTKTNLTATTNVVAAPDGNVTADKITEAVTASVQHLLQQAGSINSAQAAVASFWVKGAERTRIQAQFRNAAGTIFISTQFDLQTGNMVATTFGSPTSVIPSRIEKWSNGWYRCTVGGVLNASTGGVENCPLRLLMQDDTGAATYTGDGTSGLYVWGFQLEQGADVSSYVATTTATVTRAADSPSLAASLFPFDLTGLTWFIRFRAPNSALGVVQTLGNLFATNNQHVFQVGTAGAVSHFSTRNAVNTATTSLGLPTNDGREVVVAASTSHLNHLFDSSYGTPVANAAGTVPISATTLYVGASNGGTPLFGTIAELAVIKRAMSADEIDAIVSL